VSIVGRIVLGGALVIPLYNAAWYAWRARILRRVPACDAAERLGAIDAAWALVRECAATAAVIVLVPLGWLTPRSRWSRGDRGPLVLVHGWGANRGCFWLLRRRLLRDGWSPVGCFDYAPFGGNVEHAAAQLRVFIQELADRRPLILVGHGLGGFVVRYYLRRYPATNVGRVATLGTAHQGTEQLGSRKLRPGSEFLTLMNAGDRVPQQFDVVAIHSSFDATIVPPSNAVYPDAFNIQLPNVGHHTLLFSAKVYRLLVENLSAPL